MMQLHATVDMFRCQTRLARLSTKYHGLDMLCFALHMRSKVFIIVGKELQTKSLVLFVFKP